ncbi:MAG: hypothetical protein ACREP9_01475 [Candidatus Dormibacteraceae bacterium]
MSSNEAAKVIAKLQTLSDDRATKVLSLIDDLAELEALEDAEDLKDARESLAEALAVAAKASPSSSAEFCKDTDSNGSTLEIASIPYDQIRRELGLDR